MRKLTSGNKKVFISFTVIIVIIILLLIYELVEVLGIDKIEYEVSSGMLFYDVNYDPINIEENSKVYKKWDGRYYLKTSESEEKYSLGATGIGFNNRRIRLNLYGNFYKVNPDSSVEKYVGENIITDMGKNALYKMDDRKYLVVGKKIENETGSISTKNYLIIILDKSGNTLLLNNEINYRTINALQIITNDFKFDVANEKLLVKKDLEELEIDLKKIIGSSNEYVEKTMDENNVDENQVEEVVEEPEEEEKEEIENDDVVVQNGTIIKQEVQNINQTINNSDTTVNVDGAGGINGQITPSIGGTISGNESDKEVESSKDTKEEEPKNQTPIAKSVSLRSLTAGSTYADIEYYVTDPENKYQLVYAILESTTGESQTISLDKTKDKYRVTDLTPNTEYKLTMAYKEIVENNEVIDKIEDVMNVKTTNINAKLEVTRISSNRIFYNFKLDNNFVFDSAILKVYKDDEVVAEVPVDINSAITSNGWSSYIEKVTGYDTLTFKIESIMYEGKEINYNIETKVKSY